MFTLPKTTRIGGSETALPLKEIVKRLKDTYCNNIGVEYMFINDRSKCKFWKLSAPIDTSCLCVDLYWKVKCALKCECYAHSV